MEFQKTPLEGVMLVKPKVFEDHRGHFFESFRRDAFIENGITLDFIQDNQSLSNKGTLRGLHFQKPPFEQGKLVRVLKGAVLDVAVDIRQHSPTFGQSYSVELNEENKWMLYIPPGFAHGFETLVDNTIFVYKCTQYYNPESEGGLKWDCPDLQIPWRLQSHQLSQKDELNPLLKNFITPFNQ